MKRAISLTLIFVLLLSLLPATGGAVGSSAGHGCCEAEHHEHDYQEEVIAPTCTEDGYTVYTCTGCGDTYKANLTDPLGHDYEEVEEPSTSCTQLGRVVYTCTRCADSYEEPLPPLEHELTMEIIDPTCTEMGYTVYTCTICGYRYEDDHIEASDHNYTPEVIPATCVSEGCTRYTCANCGDSYEEEPTPRTGHEYQEEMTAPTCTEKGYTVYTCINCSDSYTDNYVDPLGHDYEEEIIPPTCNEVGYTFYTCSRCGDSYDGAQIPVTEHEYITEVIAPTCSQEGYTVHACVNCGDSYITDTTAPLAHTYSATVTAPTCEVDGYTTYTCTVCGDCYVANEIAPLGHDYSTSKVVAPTCTSGGYTLFTCATCGEIYKTDETPAIDHSYEAVVTAPDCTEGGYTTYTCTACGDYYYADEGAPLGHDYENMICTRCGAREDCEHESTTIKKAKEPTCTKEGYTGDTVCAECGEVLELGSAIPATGHTPTVVDAVEPTCTKKGYTGDTVCSVCSERLETGTSIPAIGHNESKTGETEPTCTENGYTGDTVCTNCEAVLQEGEVIPALGHNFEDRICTRCGAREDCDHATVEIKNAKEPTCTEAGYTGDKVCAECGEVLEAGSAIPAIGHNYAAAEVIEPTCTEGGYTVYTCAGCGDSYQDDETEALGHEWDEGEVTTEPTATEDGVRTYHCTRCEETKTEPIPATGEQEPCDGGDGCPSTGYRDVSANDWFHEAVDYAVANGLMNGVGNNKFDPDGAMTRAMLVTVLWRYAGEPEEGVNTFKDVKSDEWYTKAVAWAAHNGIVGGIGDNRFDPNGRITREQLATILFRYCNSKGMDPYARANLSSFPDGSKTSDYASDAISWAVAVGLIAGSKVGNRDYLQPQGNATRAQVATILMRFIKNVA